MIVRESVDRWQNGSHGSTFGGNPVCCAAALATLDLVEREQAVVDGAPSDVLSALTEGNLAYERRFGFIFIVCASGLTAEQMLNMLRVRLNNDPATELLIAAEEQA